MQGGGAGWRQRTWELGFGRAGLVPWNGGEWGNGCLSLGGQGESRGAAHLGAVSLGWCGNPHADEAAEEAARPGPAPSSGAWGPGEAGRAPCGPPTPPCSPALAGTLTGARAAQRLSLTLNPEGPAGCWWHSRRGAGSACLGTCLRSWVRHQADPRGSRWGLCPRTRGSKSPVVAFLLCQGSSHAL